MAVPSRLRGDGQDFSWLYDEMQHAGLDLEDASVLAAYDRHQSSNHEKILSLVQRLGIGPNARCVEFGCGTGAFAVAAGKAGAEVEAVDVCRAMLATARRRASDHALRNVHFHYAGFLTYRHQGALADVVVSQYALHHLPDFWKLPALLNIAQILKTGGRFYLEDVVFSLEDQDYRGAMDGWFEKILNQDGNGLSASELAAHLREQHSTFAWVLEEMLVKAGFRIEDKGESSQAYGSYFCRKI